MCAVGHGDDDIFLVYKNGLQFLFRAYENGQCLVWDS
jgi:hypothetical protein